VKVALEAQKQGYSEKKETRENKTKKTKKTYWGENVSLDEENTATAEQGEKTGCGKPFLPTREESEEGNFWRRRRYCEF